MNGFKNIRIVGTPMANIIPFELSTSVKFLKKLTNKTKMISSKPQSIDINVTESWIRRSFDISLVSIHK